jgi:Fe-S-cluster containining protein
MSWGTAQQAAERVSCTPMTVGARRFDDARVHLDVLGHTREVTTRVRVGPAQLVDALPVARAVTHALTDIGEAVASEQGQTVSCRAGCSACCRQHIILVAPVEALALARLVKALPAKRREVVRRRFAAALRRLTDLGLLDGNVPLGRSSLQTPIPPGAKTDEADLWWELSRGYAEAQVACPFLDDDKCSIYEDRPVVCREFLVTTPAERCQTFDSGVETTPRAVWMTEVLSELTATVADVPPKAIPLLLALEWVEVHGELLERTLDGEELFRRLTDLVAAHAAD